MTVSALSRDGSYAHLTRAQLIEELARLKPSLAASGESVGEAGSTSGEAFFRLIADSLPAMIFYADAGGRYRMVNRTCEEWYARPRAEIIGKHVRDILGQEAVAQVAAQMTDTTAGKTSLREDWRLYPDGVNRFVRASGTPHLSPDGELLGFFVLVDDITEAVRIRDDLIESNQYLSAIFESAKDGILTIGLDRTIRSCNAAVRRMFGRPESEIVGATTEKLYPSAEAYEAAGKAIFAGLERQGYFEDELDLQRANGEIFPALVTASLLMSGEERHGLVAVVRDLSARRQAEESLRESRELITGIAQNCTQNATPGHGTGHFCNDSRPGAKGQDIDSRGEI